MLVILGGCGRSDTLEYRPIPVQAVELVRSEAPAWSSLITDLDADGVNELLLAGHRGTHRPGFCRLEGNNQCLLQPLLEPGKDRHHCTAGDIDADGDSDLYCTAGAERGLGFGANEVWRQTDPMVFEIVPDAIGAKEESSRGRLAAFFDFNHDAWLDLVTTAWGTRTDEKDNQSKLWINVAGVFKVFDMRLPDAFGARCLSTHDVDGDGFVDLLGCPATTGLTLLRNVRASTLEGVAIGDAREWYWDIQFIPSSSNEPGQIVSSGGVREAMFIEIAKLSSSLGVERRKRISCWQATVDDDRDVYCGRLLLHDANEDGHTDILVSRRKGFRHENMLGDAPDLVIFGPSFESFTDLPTTTFGASESLFAVESGIVQINAGKDWPGSVRLLQFLPPTQAAGL